MPAPGRTLLFSDDGLNNGPYLLYKVHSRYVWDAQTISLPVAYETASTQEDAGLGYASALAQRQAAEVVRTAAENGWRIVTFDLVRWGAPPVLPSPLPTSPYEVLIRAEVEPVAPLLQPDGTTYIWAARGTYTFALTQPWFATTEALRIGASPAGVDAVNGNDTDPSQFLSGLSLT